MLQPLSLGPKELHFRSLKVSETVEVQKGDTQPLRKPLKTTSHKISHSLGSLGPLGGLCAQGRSKKIATSKRPVRVMIRVRVFHWNRAGVPSFHYSGPGLRSSKIHFFGGTRILHKFLPLLGFFFRNKTRIKNLLDLRGSKSPLFSGDTFSTQKKLTQRFLTTVRPMCGKRPNMGMQAAFYYTDLLCFSFPLYEL